MGIEALYRKPNTSRRRPGHMVYPYLLRGLEVSRPNQVWAMDITYIPMARGFVYLAAVMDWHSRKVLLSPRPSFGGFGIKANDPRRSLSLRSKPWITELTIFTQ